MVKEHTKTVHKSSAKYQYIAALVVNMLTIGFGVSLGWSSPSLILLESTDSPLPSGPISREQSSWVASLLCLGCLFGNIFFGIITSRFGRKKPMIFMTVPIIISWLLILFAQDINYLYAARTLNGFCGGGIFLIVSAFLTEISIDR